jgi:hypothetical protein
MKIINRKIPMIACFISLCGTGNLWAQACNGPGKARWPIKVSVPSGANVDKGKNVSLKDILALKDVPGVKKDDPQYQDKRIPSDITPVQLHEGDIITIQGYLHLVATESDDCDYHIQVSLSPTDGNDCIIVEVPRPEYAPTPALRDHFQNVRSFILQKLLNNKEPSGTGSVMQHPTYVSVTGQFFYDDFHVGDPPRGEKMMHAANLWEVHPITTISFAPVPN